MSNQEIVKFHIASKIELNNPLTVNTAGVEPARVIHSRDFKSDSLPFVFNNYKAYSYTYAL